MLGEDTISRRSLRRLFLCGPAAWVVLICFEDDVKIGLHSEFSPLSAAFFTRMRRGVWCNPHAFDAIYKVAPALVLFALCAAHTSVSVLDEVAVFVKATHANTR